ncbi:MAG: tetratricopeptide repeat protein [Terriglobia bacterium]
MRCRWVLILLAVALAGPVSALHGQSARELHKQGIEALNAGQFAVAERAFSRLARLHPSAATFYNLAMAEGGEGKFSQAIAHFQKSIQLGNDTPNVRYILGLAYLKAKQPASGIREFHLALTREPAFTAARYALGLALLDAGQPQEALTSLEQVRSRLSKNPWMWTNLARAQFGVGDTHAALETVEDATKAFPQNPQLFATLANLCLAHNQAQRARQLLENASEMAPADDGLKLLLARASLEAVEPMETLAVLKDVPATAGSPGEVAFLEGSALMLSGKPKQAAPLVASAVSVDPKNIRYLSTYAEIETMEEDYPGALASLKKAQLMQPASPALPYEIALINVRMGRLGDAVAASDEATRLNPKFDQPYFLAGVVQLNQGNSAAAVESLRKAVEIQPEDALYHSALGAALLKSGNLSESEKELDRALALDPGTASAYLVRAHVYEDQKQPAKAVQDLKSFVALDTDYPQAYAELAWLYTTSGQTRKASAAHCKYTQLKAKIKGHSQPPLFLSQLWSSVVRKAHTVSQ